ncbi:sodium:solute symporter family protein [Candidatus Bodocaedibacter vickermanii]|uniref:Sodium/pantothenate symporter n=1 Tax=Candidatus Bodocaedibacter vickermanii TaxID=2741701 RepID=A0A7L9RSI6_9PROT|nr:Sodium/pantothenate symporter [Candidatus Paracaedibacteraceae bacterium 'Lake Konstanz']
MNYYVFLSFLATIVVVTLIFGKLTAKKASATYSDFYLSGRSVKFFSLMMTLLATQFGGGAIIGSSEAAYTSGWLAMCYSLGIAIGFIILSLGIGGRFRTLNISTIPEVFEVAYGSSGLRRFAGLVYIVSMFLILLAVCIAMRKFFYSIGFTSDALYVGFWGVVIIYTMSGGLSAVIMADTLQIILVLSLFLLVYFTMDASSLTLNTALTPNASSIPVISWILMPCLFTIIGQDMGQRCFAAESPRAVFLATFGAGVLMVIASLFPVYLGIMGAEAGIIKGEEGIIMRVIQMVTNPVMSSLFAAGVLMAITSTANSLLCSISLNIAMDIPFIRNMPETSAKWVSRAVTFVVGMAAVAGSYLGSDVIPIMLEAYGLTVTAFFVPIVMALIYKRLSWFAGLASTIMGTTVFVLATLLNPELPDFMPKEVLGLVLSAIVFLVVQGRAVRSKNMKMIELKV